MCQCNHSNPCGHLLWCNSTTPKTTLLHLLPNRPTLVAPFCINAKKIYKYFLVYKIKCSFYVCIFTDNSINTI